MAIFYNQNWYDLLLSNFEYFKKQISLIYIVQCTRKLLKNGTIFSHDNNNKKYEPEKGLPVTPFNHGADKIPNVLLDVVSFYFVGVLCRSMPAS